MQCNAIGRAADAAFGTRQMADGYGDAIAGLRAFDALGAAIVARQDTISRSATAAAAHPAPPAGSSPGAGGAFAAAAAWTGSDAGRAQIARFASAAVAWFGRSFGPGGPEQLRLPLEG